MSSSFLKSLFDRFRKGSPARIGIADDALRLSMESALDESGEAIARMRVEANIALAPKDLFLSEEVIRKKGEDHASLWRSLLSGRMAAEDAHALDTFRDGTVLECELLREEVALQKERMLAGKDDGLARIGEKELLDARKIQLEFEVFGYGTREYFLLRSRFAAITDHEETEACLREIWYARVMIPFYRESVARMRRTLSADVTRVSRLLAARGADVFGVSGGASLRHWILARSGLRTTESVREHDDPRIAFLELLRTREGLRKVYCDLATEASGS